MKSTKMRAIGIGAVVATLAFMGTSAKAVAPPIADASGVDFDAACLVEQPLVSVGTANNVPSPGLPSCLVGTYDWSTESTDFNSVNLSSLAGQLVAEFTVDGPIPPAGSALPPVLGPADLPDDSRVNGFGYKAMFQNPNLQNNTPYLAGARIVMATPIFGLNEHWQDGFHFFVGFDAVWNGDNWLHSAGIGTYDPGPKGGFFFDELGVSRAPGVWADDDSACFPRAGGANWDVVYGPGNKVTVKVDGIVRSAYAGAVSGCVEAWYAKPGNGITNIKGLSTVGAAVTLPVIVPLSLAPGFSNMTSLGGLVSFSDTTAGTSRNVGLNATLAAATGDNLGTSCTNEGLLGNRPCVSYTPGLTDEAAASELLEVDQEHELPRAFASLPDTLGHGPRCWMYTMGGMLPSNPLWVPNLRCYIDDDNIPGPGGNFDPGERGTFLSEFWETDYSFTF